MLRINIPKGIHSAYLNNLILKLENIFQLMSMSDWIHTIISIFEKES